MFSWRIVMFRFVCGLALGLSVASHAFAFDKSNLDIEVLVNEKDKHNGADLLFTLFQVQPKGDTSAPARVGSVVRMSRDGKLEAVRSFPKGIVFDFKQQPNGIYTYQAENGFLGSCKGFNHVVIQTNSELEYQKQHVTKGLVHTNKHDFDVLPNGNHVLNAYEPVRSSKGAEFNRKSDCLQDSVVQEITPKGKVVFEWHALENYTTNQTFYKRDRGDYIHLNSTDLSDDGKTYLFSLFGYSQVAVVSRNKAELIGTLGNGGTFKFVDDPLNGFCGSHQAEWTAENRVLLFDNGHPKRCGETEKKRDYSRAVEYQLDFEAMTATKVWSYERKDIHGKIAGGATRLSNGNTIIAWSAHSKNLETAPSFTEVTPQGEVVWEARAKLDYEKLLPEKRTPRTYRIYTANQ
jgi:hypothetical protein